MRELAGEAAILIDIAAAIALERSDGSGSDLLVLGAGDPGAIAAHHADSQLAAEARRFWTARLLVLEDAFRAMAMAMEFGFLFDPHAPIAFDRISRFPKSALDPNCYDLLASEARLASFFAIAKGDIPARHWFRLGRAATPVTRGAALISWSGSMFEYLMPPLVMRAPKGSLLEQTDRLVVRRQIEYGEKLGLPWGISESAYNARDLELTYQYSNFGVPGLGLKRGLGENNVIAPYATGLATMVDPAAAAANFNRLATLGAEGRYGFYEAVDFTPTRVQEGETFRYRARLHGSSSGHDDRRDRQRGVRRRDARTLPCASRSFKRQNCCCRSGFLATLRRRSHGRPGSSPPRAPETRMRRAAAKSSPFINPRRRHSFFPTEAMP